MPSQTYKHLYTEPSISHSSSLHAGSCSSQTYEHLYFEPSFQSAKARIEYSGHKSLLTKDYLDSYRLHRKAHDVNRFLLANPATRGVMERAYGLRKELKLSSYGDMDNFVIVAKDVAFDTGFSKKRIERALFFMSSKNMGILRYQGHGSYGMTDLGKACLNDMTYRKNVAKLREGRAI